MIDLTAVLSGVVTLLTAIAASVLVPWLKGKLSQQRLTELLNWVDIAVQAAQQLYHTQKGSKRKEYVLQFLRDKGYDVDTQEMDSVIEAAVLKLHHQLEGT